jgi:hypothetical protein
MLKTGKSIKKDLPELKTHGTKANLEIKDFFKNVVSKYYPELTNKHVECPARCLTIFTLEAMIIHLNDYHKWSREKIANWLEESGNNPTALLATGENNGS